MADWHSIDFDDCLRMLGSHPDLGIRDANRRKRKYGTNELQTAPSLQPWRLFFAQFKDFMTLVLLVATLFSGLMGEYADALSIVLIILVNAMLGFIQEYRAERAIAALARLHTSYVQVRRGGEDITIASKDLVPGDRVYLQAGSRVPADIRVGHAVALQVDEAALTGESVPVAKGAEKVPLVAPLHERIGMLYSGTLLTRGHADGVVVATGMQTEMGRIAEMLQHKEREETPLQARLRQLAKYIVAACLLICTVVVFMGIYRGENPTGMFLAGVSLAVAAIPEGLPAIVTIVLAIGVQRMVKAQALVRKLPAVETLGCSSVICADKTGTLTKNEMTVRNIWLPGGMLEVGDAGIITTDLTASSLSGLECLLKIVTLSSNSILPSSKEKDSRVILGDPTEIALLAAAQKEGITRESLADYETLDEIPFDSERKRMSVLVKNKRGQSLLCCKGAPDVLLSLSSHYLDGDSVKPMTEAMAAQVKQSLEQMGDGALRVIAGAFRKLEGQEGANLEERLVLVGLLGMIDPPRPEVYEALMICKQAGITTVMVTGDHLHTAMAIGKELGLVKAGEKVFTGAELDADGRHRQRMLQEGRLFARVSPHHKLLLVRSLKKAGHVVAMTGDGVNDAPALMEADIGVAMGITGTDVAKEAAALVLRDDNFATIVRAIREGRGIYENIRKFIRYLLACNVGELLTVFFTMLLRLPLPLKPLQILWVNLVTDGLPAMALGVEPPDSDLMLRPPRPKNEGIFARGLARRILTRGVLIGVTTSAIFASAYWLADDLRLARTLAFATLVFSQLFHVFDCRSETLTIFEKAISGNWYLLISVIFSMSLFLITLYVPLLRRLFVTVALSGRHWLLVIAAAGLPNLLIAFWRSWRKRK